MEVSKTFSVVQFDQSPWFANFLKFNAGQRAKTIKGDFEYGMYNLMNNAFYGKTVEPIIKGIGLDMMDKTDTK